MEKNSSAIVAMDIRTGKPRWLYQTVHHDLWDFDIPSQPALVDVTNAQGGVDPALLQVTKQGMIFMLNRESGEPLAEVQELPVPQGHVPGERYAPTQPHSTGMPNIGNQTLKESDMWATPSISCCAALPSRTCSIKACSRRQAWGRRCSFRARWAA
jgi:quinate dehydrogenase (quinone)